MEGIEIKRVESKRDLRTFIRLPWAIYAGDPFWVPPLIMEMKDRLNRNKHPFFEHGEAAYFLASRGGETVGRIAAILDRNHNAVHGDRTGFFGLFECRNDPEAARGLVDAASRWCSDRGLTGLRGPVNLSMNDECAMLIEGFDQPPVIMMPYNPPYYLDLMAACGLAKAKDLFAFRKGRERLLSPKGEEVLERLRGSGKFTFRRVSKPDVREEARRIATIYNGGWRNNWGFVPWTDAEIEHISKNLIRLADLDIVLFAENEGRTVGFALGLPNYNQLLISLNGRLFPFGLFKLLLGRRRIKGVRALVFGVLPEYMHTGLAYLLYDEFEKAIIGNGYHWCELSWQLEDNEAINRFAASIGAVLYKKYRIYEKAIGSGGVSPT